MMQFHNYASYFSFVMVDHLIKNQVDHFFIAPGSRSTLFTSAVARHENAKKFVCIDERSLGFMSLGWAKKHQRPAVIVTTSGTAVANLYPSIIESLKSQVPLLIITADRPFELLDCSANQTTEQANIFSNHVKKTYNLAPPSPLACLDNVKGIFSSAIKTSLFTDKGPVHINIQYRDPLANIPEKESAMWPLKEDFSSNNILGTYDDLLNAFSCNNGIIVVGEMLPDFVQEQILNLAKKSGFPIYADILSNMRLKKHENIIHQFDLCLLNKELFQNLKFFNLFYFGSRVVSKRFWQWAKENSQMKFFHVSHQQQNIDQTGRSTQIFCSDLSKTLLELNDAIKIKNHSENLLILKEFSQKVSFLSKQFLNDENNNEAHFAAKLLANITVKTDVFVSSSMPIRYFDMFAGAKEIPISIYANRGVSGIDGVISTAVGMSLTSENNHSFLLIGDVAFLHDTNGLLALKELKKPMLIVVINNSGGGIFNLLPIAKEKDVLSKFFVTPHNSDLGLLCKAHDVEYINCKSSMAFEQAINDFLAGSTSMVLEVRTYDEKNAALLKSFYRDIEQLRIS